MAPQRAFFLPRGVSFCCTAAILRFSGVAMRLDGDGPRLLVLRYRVPHALHSIGLLAGPRRHCGESNAPQ